LVHFIVLEWIFDFWIKILYNIVIIAIVIESNYYIIVVIAIVIELNYYVIVIMAIEFELNCYALVHIFSLFWNGFDQNTRKTYVVSDTITWWEDVTA
jgi:hypothetical protein